MHHNPLVSILIPCYNVSPYVERAVQSILSQSYNNLEVWLIDDASTDDTLTKLLRITDKRVKLIAFEENTCKVGAVNAVLKQVNGDFVAFQDADDWSEPNRIEYQVDQFNRDPEIGICFTNYELINRSNSKFRKVALTDDELKDEFLLFRNRKNSHLSPTMCATMMITRNVLQDTTGYHPFFAGRVAEDIHWVYRILKNYKGISIDKPLYNVNIRKGSLTEIQFSGMNSKAAYSWQLLSKVIQMDVHEKIDVLAPHNKAELNRLELIACEEALIEATRFLHQTKITYETSWSYRLGKFILMPLHLLKRIINQVRNK